MNLLLAQNPVYKEHLNLKKSFFLKLREDDVSITYASNQPNNIPGDQQFEWDLDGSQRKKWQERMDKLKAEGRYGDLEYTETIFVKNPILDIAVRQPANRFSNTILFIDMEKF